MNIAIIGSGSWGVALAIHLAKLENKIKLWSFSEEEKDLINNERNQYQRMKLLCELRPPLELVKSISDYIQGDYLESLCILGYDRTKACGYCSTTMRNKIKELSTDLTGLMIELDKIFFTRYGLFLTRHKRKIKRDLY